MELKDWISQTKLDNPELSDFIVKLEGFISDTGFNIDKFEQAVRAGLKQIETDLTKIFVEQANAQNQEDNN